MVHVGQRAVALGFEGRVSGAHRVTCHTWASDGQMVLSARRSACVWPARNFVAPETRHIVWYFHITERMRSYKVVFVLRRYNRNMWRAGSLVSPQK